MRDPEPNDEELEAWFRRHRGRLEAVRTAELKRVAPWLPIIGVPANDTLAARDE